MRTPTHPFARLALFLSATCVVSGLATAQTGPFANHEVLVRSPGISGLETIYRIDPVAGVGVPLIEELFPNYSGPGWMNYDPSRDAILAFTSWSPTGLFDPRLLAISEDGSVLDLGFKSTSERITAITPVGDGRVYCNKPSGLHLLDVTNTLVPVLDHLGQPVTDLLDHLHYHAPTNSLIGVTAQNTAAPCYEFRHVAVQRLPLTPNGKQLSGPITCTNYDINASGWPIGIDPLPGGFLLVSVTGVSPFADEVFLRVNPFTLTISLWGESTLNDINGGIWSVPLQRVIVIDDVSNEFRTFTPGQSDGGSFLPVNVPLGDSTTGVSSTNTMFDIELVPGACGGSSIAFGERLAGSGGVEPKLSVNGCPTIGGNVTFVVAEALGGTAGILAIGAATAPFPLVGGTFYVAPPFLAQLPLGVGGVPGVAGDGAAVLPLPTPANGNLVGIPFFAQAGLADGAAPSGFALTNAVKFTLGN